MDLDNITDVEWFRIQLKRFCAKVIKDVPNTNFKAGNYYVIEQDEYGTMYLVRIIMIMLICRILVAKRIWS